MALTSYRIIAISSPFQARKSLLLSEHLAEFASANADDMALSTPTVHMQKCPEVLACSHSVK
ncbi:MAG: hypothetical protein ACYDEJ_12455 [Desulfitobacteriaceae bacterium]